MNICVLSQASNTAAINLYESFNYKCVQVIPNYYSDGEAAWCMELNSLETETPKVTQRSIKNQVKLSMLSFPWISSSQVIVGNR